MAGQTEVRKSEWLCISCGKILGKIVGGELSPLVDGQYLQTRGPNLVVNCPECASVKVFYTADPIVRALYQLIDAMVSVAARRMVETVSAQTMDVVRRSMNK